MSEIAAIFMLIYYSECLFIHGESEEKTNSTELTYYFLSFEYAEADIFTIFE